MSSKQDFSTFNFAADIQIRFADMDNFGHVNNAIYLTYFEIARGRYWRDVIKWDWKALGIIIARAEIDYVSQLTMHHKAKVYLRTSRVGNTSFDIEYAMVRIDGEGAEILVAQGKTVCVVFDYKNQRPTTIPDEQRARMEDDLIPQKGTLHVSD